MKIEVMGLSRLVITIEVDESSEDTFDLLDRARNSEKLKVKDLFHPDAEILVTSLKDGEAVDTHLPKPSPYHFGEVILPKKPKPSEVKAVMMTRGGYKKSL